ncbi:hypothetical protein BDP81DRAFT_1043 [Colletotrichum phormii]|uniref:Uncharacterized protein n=1 Tax=Colletotrichum phormii TaxID=359342 RepID=A0AAJ0EN39_9PEZI|nr:uncharacterized protein BDP81DRAFT_1043 [Colletotrichum phormii]KAK1655219.1 hypothetical protein BDP81DRAFT_1043 [Colletotrichum phormii]
MRKRAFKTPCCCVVAARSWLSGYTGQRSPFPRVSQRNTARLTEGSMGWHGRSKGMDGHLSHTRLRGVHYLSLHARTIELLRALISERANPCCGDDRNRGNRTIPLQSQSRLKRRLQSAIAGRGGPKTTLTDCKVHFLPLGPCGNWLQPADCSSPVHDYVASALELCSHLVRMGH